MNEGINRSHKVVIVDNDQEYLTNARIALSAPGCTVIECLDAESAIAAILEHTNERLLLVITALSLNQYHDGVGVANEAKSKSARVIIQSNSENDAPPSGVEFRFGKLRPYQLDEAVNNAIDSLNRPAPAEPPRVR